MKEKTLYLASIIIAFIFGSLGTYLLMTKQQMDQVMLGRQQAVKLDKKKASYQKSAKRLNIRMVTTCQRQERSQ